MQLGWSLQRPVTGVAAWLMVMIKRPFMIGDRIIIQGVRGDVLEISPMTKTVSINTRLNVRYDSEPPAGVKSHDLEIVNGLRYKF